MDEQIGKKFIRIAAVLFLLLFVAIGQDFKCGTAEEQKKKCSPMKQGISEESGQADGITLLEGPLDVEDLSLKISQEGSDCDEDTKEMEVYRDVLEEYAQAIGEDEDEVYVAGKWKYVYDLLYYVGKKRGILYYSLKNLSDHDNRELIIGILDNGEYIPYIVYGDWGDGIVELCISEDHEMRIYEGGVIELRLEGVYYSVIGYYQLGEEVIIENLEREVGENGEITGYIRKIFLNRYHTVEEEITEEEYLGIIERYTAVPVELEWRPLKGF